MTRNILSGRESPDEKMESARVRLAELIELGGRAKIAEMLDRFVVQLEAFSSSESDVVWSKMDVHRMVGTAAMLGFSEVEATWRVVETTRPGSADIAAAKAAAQEAIRFARHWSQPDF